MEECCICWELIQKNEKKKLSCQCNCFYHENCINKWYVVCQKYDHCPYCRKNVVIHRYFDFILIELKKINKYGLYILTYFIVTKIYYLIITHFVFKNDSIFKYFCFIRIYCYFEEDIFFNNNEKEKMLILLLYFYNSFCYDFLFFVTIILSILIINNIFFLFFFLYKKKFKSFRVFMH